MKQELLKNRGGNALFSNLQEISEFLFPVFRKCVERSSGGFFRQKLIRNYIVAGLITWTLFIAPGTTLGAIAVRGTATNQSSNSSITINKPAGVVAGDVMIANITQTCSDNSISVSPTLSGWTLISGTNLGNGDDWGAVLYRVADGTEGPSFTFSLDNDADGNVGGIVAFSGVDALGGVKADGTAGGPFDVDPGNINVANSSTATATSISTITTNAAVVMFEMTGNDRTLTNWTTTSPGNLTELYDVLTTNGDDANSGAAWAIKPTTGSTGNGLVTLSQSDRNGAILVALKFCSSATATPVITSTSLCPGATSVSGTSSEANGTVITVLSGGVSIGTTTVASNAWTLTVAALTAGNVITATASASGKCLSAVSSSVTVQSSSATPVVTSPICPGATSVNGTSSEANGTTITIFKGGVFQATTTVSSGAWTLSGMTALVAGDVITATASATGKCVSALSTSVTVAVSATPVVTSPLCAGATSVSGTSSEANGTVITVFKGGVSQGTTTVTSNAWTRSGIAALVAGDVITATATAPGKCVSPVSSSVTVQSTSATPVITSPICPGATSVSGTSSEADGTIITVFKGGVSQGTTTVTSNAWTLSGMAALIAGNVITATASVAGKCTSAISSSVTVNNSATPVVNSPICPGATSVSGTCAEANGTVITVYKGGVSQGTTTVTSNAWTLSGMTALLTGDVITATALAPGKCLSPVSAPVTVTTGAPATPGAITGTTQQCPGLTLQTYSITAVPNSTTYTWTVPTGWNITAGQGTVQITVTTGSAGQNGNISVTASNANCGTSAASTLTVVVNPGAPTASPGAITGTVAVCSGNPTLIYSIAAVANATIYTWAVPTGWSITAGQGSTSITVTAGSAGQNGYITVTAGNSCGTGPNPTQTVNINPTIGTNNTGYTDNSTKTDGNIITTTTGPERRGYAKFPLGAIPAGATITSSSLTVTNNGSISGSTATNNITALGNNDPTTATVSNLYSAIGSGTSYNASQWTPTGTITLTLNATANADIQSRFLAPGYIGMGLLRAGSNVYNFFGYAGPTPPVLAVTYTGIRSLAVTVGATPAVSITGNTSICAGSTTTLTPTSGGTWISNSPSVASVTNGGVVTGLTTGAATFTFTSSTAPNCAATTSSVSVTALPVVSFTGSTSICENTTTTLSPTSGGTWVSNSPAVASVTNAGLVTGLTAGSATFTFTSSTAPNCSKTTSALTVKAIPTTVSTSPPFTTSCSGSPVALTASATTHSAGSPAALFSWTANTGAGLNGLPAGAGTPLASNNNISVTPSVSTIYTLTATDPVNGCAITATGNDTIDIIPPLTAANAGPDQTDGSMCGSSSATLEGNTPSVGTGSWNILSGTGGNIATPSDTNSLFSGVAGNTYLLAWTISDPPCNPSIDTVVISFNNDPVITCPADITVNATNGQCSAIVNFVATATGAPAPAISYSQNPNTSFSVGTTLVTVIASNNCGTDTCRFNVTVIDNQNPVITGCPSNITVNNAPGICGRVVNWTVPTASDNCSGVSLTTTHNPGTLFPVGTTLVTYTATDAHGNSVTCSFNVVVNDNQNPVITGCPVNISANVDPGVCGAAVSWTVPTATDNCPGVTFTSNHSPGETFPVGPTLVTYTASDTHGHSVTCSFNVLVIDNEFPVISDCPFDIELNTDPGQCGAVATWVAPTATDNCTFTFTSNYDPGDLFPIGTTSVIYTATDSSSYTSICFFSVTVNDNQVPIITCPSDATVPATANCQAVLGNYTGAAIVIDNCSTTVSQSPAPGTLLGLGDHIITLTATDGSGNQDDCTFTVHVTDQTAPTITCPGNATVAAGVNCTALLADYTSSAITTDNCSPGSITVAQSPVPGTILPVGNHTITLTASDPAGNSNSCTFTVHVTDQTAPSITCPSDATVAANANCQAVLANYTGAATASDNCSVTVTQSPVTGTLLALGDHTIKLIATDGAGNKDSCTFIVHVTDQTPPTISCPSDATVAANANCQAVLANYTGAATASDNCSVTVTQSPAAGTILTLGDHTITLTATDGAGNQASCTFIVHVTDQTAPTISCPGDATVAADANCTVSLSDYISSATTDDNCSAVTVTQSPVAGTILALGDHTITLTATDLAGNSSSCTFTVHVTDQTAPTITCPSDATIAANANCQAALANYTGAATASDNCSVTVTQSPTAGTLLALGNHTITLTATDGAGNQDNCTFIVHVTDQTAPTISCPSDATVAANANCQAVLSNYTGAATASDNCSVTVTQSPAAGTILAFGDHTITLIATDGAGNQDNCTFTLHITDQTAPTISCPADVTVNTDINHCYATGVALGSPVTGDNCGVASTNNDAPAQFSVGITDVTWTVTDIHGLTATCIQHVTVVPTFTSTSSFLATACDLYLFPWGGSANISGAYDHTYATIEGCDSVVTVYLTVNPTYNNAPVNVSVCDNQTYPTLPWGGTAAAGNNSHTYTSVNNCDSTVTIHLTVNPTYNNAPVNVFVCDNQTFPTLPWGGTAVAGNNLHTYALVNGCDSTVIIHLTVNPTYNNAPVNVSVCDNQTFPLLPWGGTAVAGDNSHTYVSVNGCDSTVTIHLTVNPTYNNAPVNVSVCDNQTFPALPWGGTALAGNNSHTYVAMNGCDSTVTIHLTVNPTYNNTPVNVSVCDSQTFPALPWGGTAIAGNNVHTYASVNGCDSTVTILLTVNPTYNNAPVNISVCDNQTLPTLPWGGTAIAGNNVHTYASVNGCDSTVTIHLTVNPAYTNAQVNVSVCDNQPYPTLPWGGTALAGNNLHTYASVNGCDSTVTIHLTVNPTYNNAPVNVSVCDNHPYPALPWSGIAIAGDNFHTYTSVNGCDSTVTIHLTVNPTYNNAPVNVSICDNQTFPALPWGGTAIAGDNFHTYTSVNGCDSTVTIHLTVNPTYNNAPVNVSVCDNQTFPALQWGGTAVAGNNSHTYASVNGCDSTVTIYLTVNPTYNNSPINVSVCDNQTFPTLPWGGTAVAGNNSHTYSSMNGCDSTATIQLTVNPTYNNAPVNVSVCDNQTFPALPWGGTAVAGDNSHTYASVNGCDSTVIIHLTVNPTYNNAPVNISVCDNQTFPTLPWGGTTVAGNNVHTYPSVNGCDSMVTIHLTVNPAYNNSPVNVSVCDNQTYPALPWGGTAVAGNNSHTYVAVNGCDSTVTIHLTVNPTYNNAAVNVSVCDNQPYPTLPWGGTAIAGDNFHTYTSVNGCDSTVTIHLTVNPSYNNAPVNITICFSQTYPTLPWGGTAVAGDNVHTYTSVNGCDSTVTIHLTVIPAYNDAPAEVSVCANQTYPTLPWGGIAVAGNNSHTYAAVNGCDSTVTIHLTVNPTYNNSPVNVSVCDNQPYPTLPWGGTAIAGDNSHTYASVNGCDSTVTIHLTVNLTYNNGPVNVSVCDNQPYPILPWGGTAIAGDNSHTYASVNGCDSTVTIHLTVTPTFSSAPVNVSVCANQTYPTLPWGGSALAGNNSHTYTAVNGCDSIVTIHLTVSPTYNNAPVNVSVCENQTYPTLPWGGTATGGDNTHTYASVNGCDSTVTIHLTVNPTYNNAPVNVSACDNQPFPTLPWGGTAVLGDNSHTYASVNGCDSTVTIHVTANPTYNNAPINVSVCNNQTYPTLPWGGTAVAGDNSHTYASVNGCDSTATIHLMVLLTTSSSTNVTICPGGSYTPPGGTAQTTAGVYVTHILNAAGCDSAITTNLSLLTQSTTPTGVVSNSPFNEVCNSNSTTLTVQGGSLGSGASWVWYEGGCGTGSSLGTGSSIIVTPLTTKTYYVRAEGTCGNSLCASITITVKTSGPGGIITTVNGPAVGCAGGTGIVTCNSVPNATYYTWSSYPGTLFNGQPGPYQTTVPSVTVTYGPLPVGAGGYNVCVYAGNACGVTINTKCWWIAGTVSVPTLSNTNSAIACAGDTLPFSVVNQAGATYTWSITGNASILSGQGTSTVSVRFLPGWTTGNLCVYASLSCGASSASRCTSISNAPGLPGVMSGPIYVCPGSTYVYTVGASVGASSYNWTAPAGCTVVNNGTSANITFPAGFVSGPVVVAAVSRCGIQSTTRYQTVVSNRPGMPAAIQGEAYGVCGQQFIYTIPSVSNATGYAWIVPAGASIVNGQNSNSITVSFPTGFTNGNICVTATNSCGSGGQRCILVKGSPATPVPISGSTSVCAGSIQSYSVVAGTGAVTHTWTVPAGTGILSGQGTSSITMLWGGTGGNIGVVAYNGCGNSGGPRTLAVAITCRLSQQQIRSMIPMNAEAYPNPTQGKLTVKFMGISDENYYVRIIDMTSRLMLSEIRKGHPGENLHELDLSNFAKGIYLLDIQNSGEKQIIRISID